MRFDITGQTAGSADIQVGLLLLIREVQADFTPLAAMAMNFLVHCVSVHFELGFIILMAAMLAVLIHSVDGHIPRWQYILVEFAAGIVLSKELLELILNLDLTHSFIHLLRPLLA